MVAAAAVVGERRKRREGGREGGREGVGVGGELEVWVVQSAVTWLGTYHI